MLSDLEAALGVVVVAIPGHGSVGLESGVLLSVVRQLGGGVTPADQVLVAAAVEAGLETQLPLDVLEGH